MTHQAGSGLWYFPLLAAALPFVWWTSRLNRYHPRPVVLLWGVALTVSVGTGFAAEEVCYKLDAWPVLFAGVFAVLYLVGVRWWGEASSVWQRPLQNVGALGAVGVALVLSFTDTWPNVTWSSYWESLNPLQAGLQLVTAAIFPVAALLLWLRSWSRQSWGEVIVGPVSLLAVIGWIAAMFEAEVIGAVMFNLYLSLLGIGTLVIGFRGRRLATVNGGMAVLAALILCRFFDSDLNFLVRGIAFIVIGVGFLMTNLMLLRWKGAGNR